MHGQDHIKFKQSIYIHNVEINTFSWVTASAVGGGPHRYSYIKLQRWPWESEGRETMHDRNTFTVLYPGRKYILFLQNKICTIIAMKLKVDSTSHFISHSTSVLLPKQPLIIFLTLLLSITSEPHIKRNKDSVVSVVTIRAGWTTYKTWFDSRQGQQGSLFFKTYISAVRPSRPPVHWVPRVISAGI